MITLGIETSCDETSVAVLKGGRDIMSNIILSQIDIHKEYGGVVPEVASRKHIENINIVIEEALEKANIGFSDLDLVAATKGPGLVGALLVGLSAAKALAYGLDIPFLGVNHLHGHICSNFIDNKDLEPPFVSLVVSGGHTFLLTVDSYTDYKIYGRTLDDAAGEAFDKVARSLGLEYPGGPIIDRLAKEGDRKAVDFPRVMLDRDNYDFSFSGLKTAVLNYINQKKQKGEEIELANLAASFQEAVVEVLVEKTIRLAKEKSYDKITLAGGVGANSRLREYLDERAKEEGMKLYFPSKILCTDNGAMIASSAYFNYKAGKKTDFSLRANPNLGL